MFLALARGCTFVRLAKGKKEQSPPLQSNQRGAWKKGLEERELSVEAVRWAGCGELLGAPET